MCILFLLVGDGHQRPTVICSNRDEFFDRPTHRGSVQYTNGADTYSPVDVEGGGTWLAFDGLGANALRYAVVLNFHHWREHNLADEPQRRYWTKNNCSPLSLRSRGLLPKDFISKAVLSAQAYAREIFEERLLYRPFNLVLGDASGTYYVSSSSQQQAPLRLLPGRLYAISNGYITDAWQRTTVGRGLVAAVLQRAPQKGEEEYDGDEQETGGEVDAFSTRVALSLDEGADLVPLLLDVLADITPLPDPVFHRSNQAAERMSAVCVSPVIIVRGLPGALWMSMAASLLLELCSLLTGESHFFRPGGRAAVWTWGTAFTFLRSVLVAALIQSRFLPAKDERQTEDPQLAVRRRRDWFGTRTSTVLVHAGSPVPANGDTALANGGIVEASEGTDANGGNGGTGEGGSRFWLSERDLDPVQLTWSTASFSNS